MKHPNILQIELEGWQVSLILVLLSGVGCMIFSKEFLYISEIIFPISLVACILFFAAWIERREEVKRPV
jgi:hypothetical protein